MFVTSPMWSFSPGRGYVSAHERKLTRRTGEVTTSSAKGSLEINSKGREKLPEGEGRTAY